MPRHYRPRYHVTVAIQFDGTNTQEIVDWLGPANVDFDEDSRHHEIFTTDHNTWRPLYLGNWAVRDDIGRVAVYDDHDFEMFYEPIGE